MKKSDLLGSWALVRACETLDGKVIDATPLGEKPTGFIHYTPDDRVAVLIAHDGRKPISNGERRAGPVAELAAAAKSFDAYGGPYTVRDEHTVVHRLEVSSFQNDLGKDYVRKVTLTDEELHLTTPETKTPTGVRSMTLVWRRL